MGGDSVDQSECNDLDLAFCSEELTLLNIIDIFPLPFSFWCWQFFRKQTARIKLPKRWYYTRWTLDVSKETSTVKLFKNIWAPAIKHAYSGLPKCLICLKVPINEKVPLATICPTWLTVHGNGATTQWNTSGGCCRALHPSHPASRETQRSYAASEWREVVSIRGDVSSLNTPSSQTGFTRGEVKSEGTRFRSEHLHFCGLYPWKRCDEDLFWEENSHGRIFTCPCSHRYSSPST